MHSLLVSLVANKTKIKPRVGGKILPSFQRPYQRVSIVFASFPSRERRVSVRETPKILSMSWFYPGTVHHHESTNSLQPLQDNLPLMPDRYESYGSLQRQRTSASLDLLVLPNTPRYISSPDPDTSVLSNGKEHRKMADNDLEKDSESNLAPGMKGPTQLNQRHYCRIKGCRHTKGFVRVNDLKRHQKKHDGDTPLWYCGCCKNMGDDGYKGTPRKDHLKQHLIIKHKMENPHDCPEHSCSGRGRILYSSGPCVEEHLRQEHGYKTTNESPSSGCDCYMRRREGEVSLQM